MSDELTLNANPEHTGIRLAVPLILISALVLTYWLLIQLLPSWLGGEPYEYWIISSCPSLLLALALTFVLDRIFKRVWHSGDTVQLGATQVSFKLKKEAPVSVPLGNETQITRWYFRIGNYPRIGRERQIQVGWYCVAYEVREGDRRLAVHCFVPPRKAQQYINAGNFTELDMTEVRGNKTLDRVRQFSVPGTRPEIPGKILSTPKGRYWLAEQYRWDHGLELKAADFQRFVTHLKQHA